MMKINQISKKLIKPATPTPQNLKNYDISLLDQFVGPVNLSVILLYKSYKPDYESRLEESLAKILVDFYPLAGRYIKKDQIVDCSDQGAQLVKAEAPDVELLDLIKRMETEQLDVLFPGPYLREEEAADDPLLSVQITHFPCGGVAVALTVPHKIFDGASLDTFVAAWSNATNLNDQVLVDIAPAFGAPSSLRKEDNLDFGTSFFTVDGNIRVMKLVFDEVALTCLRSKMKKKDDGSRISGVRVVCAAISKAFIGTDRATHGKARDFVALQSVNLRGRTIPPLPKHACGNLFVMSVTERLPAAEAEAGVEIEGLVDLIGDAVRRTIGDHAEILSPDRDGRNIIMYNMGEQAKQCWNPETNILLITDWSKFGFHEADFGWGKPVFINTGPQRPPISTVVLMSNIEGVGIDVWVYTNQDKMRFFEQDEDIKLYMA